MILVHVSADDKVVAFSIPRDDWVPFTGVPGYNHIKIKEAYGLTKQYVEQKLINKGVSDQKELETKGREAARAATLNAVRKLTGVPIDYFAEVNLAGFYDLAKSLGGVDVCLKHAVYDDYSGADFPAGPQTLDAAQALAFVRQRHGLDNGDLDRTHRQQAFLSSVMHQLQDAGTFTNLDKLKSLMAVARKDVVLSSGWDEDMFRNGWARWPVATSNTGRCPWCATTTSTVKTSTSSTRRRSRPKWPRRSGPPQRPRHDHRGHTHPVHRRRRGQRQRRGRSGHPGCARAEEARLHRGPGTRPGIG